ncbi:MAG TPA: hypothetical protein VER83_09790, partial [Candidatus Nanopelagicales bacterium]|nr:hypothetical protein [Candidatus Nanopelagicales bacterium]
MAEGFRDELGRGKHDHRSRRAGRSHPGRHHGTEGHEGCDSPECPEGLAYPGGQRQQGAAARPDSGAPERLGDGQPFGDVVDRDRDCHASTDRGPQVAERGNDREALDDVVERHHERDAGAALESS